MAITRIGVLLGSCLVGFVGATPAQQSGSANPPQEPASGGPTSVQGPPRAPAISEPTRLERVVAIVGDSAILERELRELVDARYEALVAGGRAVDRKALRRETLQQLVDRNTLAQGARTLGIIEPERVDAWLDQQMAKFEREQTEAFGSYGKMKADLDAQNRSWETMIRDQEIQKLHDITRWTYRNHKLQDQVELFITPKEMKQYFLLNLDRYQFGPRAQASQLAFPKGDGEASRQTALDAATKAAVHWREQGVTQEAVTERAGASVLQRPDLENLSNDDVERLGDRATFALGQDRGTVSDPLETGSAFWVLKVVDRAPGQHEDLTPDEVFLEPGVQSQIRRELESRLYGALDRQSVLRSQIRTYVWAPDLQGR